MDNFPIPVWYSKPGSDKRVKALLYGEHDGYATFALESGRFVVDHIEYVTLAYPRRVFAEYLWEG